MRLRRSTKAPERYEDEPVYTRQPPRGPTVPAFPKLLAQSTVPFSPDLPVTAWVSKSLRDPDADTPDTGHEADGPKDPLDVTTFSDTDQCSSATKIDWQQSNNLIIDMRHLADAEVSSTGGDLVSPSGLDANMEDVASEPIPENVSWCELSLAMQVQIYTRLEKEEGPLTAVALLALSDAERRHIDSHWRFRIIYPVHEEQLREEWLREAMNIQLQQSTFKISQSDQSAAAKELEDKYMKQMVQHYNYSYASEREIEMALAFLKARGLSSSLAGTWKDDEDTALPAHPTSASAQWPAYGIRPANRSQSDSNRRKKPVPSGNNSEPGLSPLFQTGADANHSTPGRIAAPSGTQHPAHPAMSAPTKHKVLVPKHTSLPLGGPQNPTNSQNKESNRLDVPGSTSRSPGSPQGQSNTHITSHVAREALVFPVTPNTKDSGQHLPMSQLKVKLKIRSNGEAVLRKDKTRKRSVTHGVTESAKGHSEPLIEPPTKDPQNVRLVHPRRIILREGKLVELPDEPDAFTRSMYQLGLNARNEYLQGKFQDRLRLAQESSPAIERKRNEFDRKLLGLTTDYLLEPTTVQKSPALGQRHEIGEPSSPSSPPWSPITQRSRSISFNASRHASMQDNEMTHAAAMRGSDLSYLPEFAAENFRAHARPGRTEVTGDEAEKGSLETSPTNIVSISRPRPATTANDVPLLTDSRNGTVATQASRSKMVAGRKQEILPKISFRQKANDFIDSALGTSRANSGEDETQQRGLQDTRKPSGAGSQRNTTGPSATGSSDPVIYPFPHHSQTTAATLNAVSEKLKTSPSKAIRKASSSAITIDANRVAFSPTMPMPLPSSIDSSSAATPTGATTPSQTTKPRTKRGPYRKTRERMQNEDAVRTKSASQTDMTGEEDGEKVSSRADNVAPTLRRKRKN